MYIEASQEVTFTHPVNIVSEETLLEFCNEVREIGGGDVLDALLPGYKQDPHFCLIARNLNFDCEVTSWVLPQEKGSEDTHIAGVYSNMLPAWVMIISDKETQDKIATELGLEIVEHWGDSGLEKAILLPKAIGLAAAAFDEGLAFTELNQRTSTSVSMNFKQ